MWVSLSLNAGGDIWVGDSAWIFGGGAVHGFSVNVHGFFLKVYGFLRGFLACVF